jgi:hypothetical protein
LKQPLRQTEGFVRSLFRLMGLDPPVPDYSTWSRRGAGLILPMKARAAGVPGDGVSWPLVTGRPALLDR